MCAVAGLEVDQAVRQTLVEACMRAEREVAGAPTGGMDQAIALFAQAEHALLVDCRDWSTRQVQWDPDGADLALLVVDTRASHTLSDGGYESRRRDCERAAGVLGVSLLREVEDATEALARLDDETVRRRTRHVLSEMARVDQAVEELEHGDFAALGRTFIASHESLRDDFEVSCAELDVVVDTAVANGALGARMTGGGFGGSAIALLPRADLTVVRDAVATAFASRRWPAPGFLTATAAAGAHRHPG
jgi:galactokinase